MTSFNEREQQTILRICDTLIPALQIDAPDVHPLYETGAYHLNIPQEVIEILPEVASPEDLTLLRIFFGAIEFGVFNGMTANQWGAFSQAPLETRTAILQSWANSRLPIARRTFQALKRLTLFLFYSTMPDDNRHPAWQTFNYDGPPQNNASPAPTIEPYRIDETDTLYTHVLVIGSGAGGGVVAGELAAAGFDVIVAEKGGYYHEADFHGKERDSAEQFFEKRGALTTADNAVLLLAGSTLGGGTTINWTASFRTPQYVLREWATQYGFTGAASADFQASLDAVSERIHVCTEASHANPQNELLAAGCKALGYKVDVIPRNVKDCQDCGFCNFGCRFGAKQSTLKTYLQDAHKRGARILVRAHVERVTYKRGVANGAIITITDSNQQQRRITIKAKVVVVAAGALHTPALLLRSGLGNANIGANLHLHPATVIYGLFDEPVRGWEGPPMTRYSPHFANMDGAGYGFRLETAPVHPGIAALTLPWQSGRQHKDLMQQLDHLANILIIVRDRHGGRVQIDRDGNPVPHYWPSRVDRRHLMRGILEALRVHHAAGAKELSSPHNAPLLFRDGQDGDFEDYLDRVAARSLKRNAFPLFSAHQMSSCRIGGDTSRGAVDPTGESYEVKNLFVADGSVLPTASGVNPMVTIMATAHFIAQHIKSKL
ncbi:MAG: oxidoreductase [Chloroflexi bacterium]|nr:MAG: oxidoreductase [Chloroflexota bacterium]